jgi:hypothetical protein
VVRLMDIIAAGFALAIVYMIVIFLASVVKR